jgi:hypothetical protein
MITAREALDKWDTTAPAGVRASRIVLTEFTDSATPREYNGIASLHFRRACYAFS